MAAKTGDHGKPKRLRPWLEGLLNRNDTPGLHWIDPDKKTMFRIPWKHRGKQDWSPEHSLIFKEWAIQTGRYREGIDDEDYPTWKTRLRCAFNKAPDIEEVRSMRSVDSPEPYRVYRFIAVPAAEGRPRGTRNSIIGAPKTESVELYNEELISSDQPTDFQEDGEENSISRTRQWLQQQENNEDDDEPIAKQLRLKDEPFQTMSEAVLSKCDTILTTYKAASLIPDIADNGFVVTITYLGRKVREISVDSKDGCMLCFNDTPMLKHLVRGDALIIPLPPPSNFLFIPQNQRLFMEKMLTQGLERGIYVERIGNDLYARRHCRVATYYYEQKTPWSLSDENDLIPAVKKLPRTEFGQKDNVCIFHHSSYHSALNDYLNGKGSKPDDKCTLILGQDVQFNERYDKTVLVSITVSTNIARRIMTDLDMFSETPDFHSSESADVDTFLLDNIEVEDMVELPQLHFSPP